MKWIGRLMGSAAAVLLTTGAGVSNPLATSKADHAWANAVKRNTLEAYVDFAMTYPQSVQAVLAHRKLQAPGTSGARGHLAMQGVPDLSPESTTIDLMQVPLLMI
jgi:hypothetical protein